MSEEFSRANAGRLNILLDEIFSTDDQDFKPFLARLKRLPGLDAIYVNLFLSHIGLFARQAREMEIHQPLFTSEFFENPGAVEVSRGALIGQWYVMGDVRPEFLAEFERRFPDDILWCAANGHDAIMMIARAVELGKTSREDINNFLHSISGFSGALGTYSVMTDGRFDLPVTVKVVTGRGFEKLVP